MIGNIGGIRLVAALVTSTLMTVVGFVLHFWGLL